MTTINRFLTRTVLSAACIAVLAAADPQPALRTVTAWGDNGEGQLGNNTMTKSSVPVDVVLPPGVKVVSVTAGQFNNLAVTSDGLYAWGSGTTGARTNFIAVKIVFPSAVTTVPAAASGEGHSLAITNDGLYSWGANDSGQLGDGTTVTRWTPARVIFPPAVTQITRIAAGYNHSLAFTNDGLYAWGYNGTGGVGDGTFVNKNSPVKVLLPAAVTMVTQLAAGFEDSFAVTNHGLYAWGYNFFGQLGIGTDKNHKLAPVQVTLPEAVTKITRIAAGQYHALAVTNDGLYAWGYNSNGELGDGSRAGRISPVKISFPDSVTAIGQVGAGGFHSLAVTNDGVYAWGNNAQGQLGTGDHEPQLSPARTEEKQAIHAAAGMYHSVALHIEH